MGELFFCWRRNYYFPCLFSNISTDFVCLFGILLIFVGKFGKEYKENRNSKELSSKGSTFRQYFFRLSSFFSHKLFTNYQYDKAIKRTTNYFFDRFFSYFPLLEPFHRRFFFYLFNVPMDETSIKASTTLINFGLLKN